MTGLTMADSAFNDQFPAGFDAYAGYVDGRIGDQPNYDWIVTNLPGFHLSITVLGNDADCLDIESRAATVSSAAEWYAARKKAGVKRPVFYASVSLMNSELLPAIRAAGVLRSGYRLWSAHYGSGKHICGPSSCGLLDIFADGTQWTDHAGRLTADQSLLIPSFFSGITPPDPVIYIPQAETDAIMSKLPLLKQGASDTRLPHWYVRRVQAVLNAVWHAGLAVDGEYGPKTAGAISALQKEAGLPQDGSCDAKTWSLVVAGE